MAKGQYIRCQIHEWDWAMYCRKKGDWISYIDEQHPETGDMYRSYYLVCKSHWDWLGRPKSMHNLDYDIWVNNL